MRLRYNSIVGDPLIFSSEIGCKAALDVVTVRTFSHSPAPLLAHAELLRLLIHFPLGQQ